ncbi:DUF4266 domain-containing protein [Methylomonas albis]|jgi:hypothetical protein|uniref:DUF4266 domain-containing protein n=1 Tax=Methylomonas albis TaxID=1854563 RepID=A0ABR9D173_9GAMM|nr:DUF4266 domain-containing protein [Methylomonas albis]MBD9356879.1 DUF4266 domain-containing protein [Methylomonas albis]
MRRVYSASCLLLALVFQGCAEVSPWERGNLAREDMSISPNPNLTHFREHIFTSKEATQGGHNGGGGGCGCN